MLAVAFSSFYPSRGAFGFFICRRVQRLPFSIFHFAARLPAIPSGYFSTSRSASGLRFFLALRWLFPLSVGLHFTCICWRAQRLGTFFPPDIQHLANLFLSFLLFNSFNSFFLASGIFILIPVILQAASAASLVFLLSVAFFPFQ